MIELLKRAVTYGVVGALVLLGLILAWQWLRIDTSLSVFHTGREYLHENLGLSMNVATMLTAAATVAVFVLMGVLWPSPRLAAAVAAVLLVGGVPLAHWVDSSLAAKSCFHRKTGAALCDRWQSPKGCQIVRKDGARPAAPWRLLREATEEDVAFCAGDPTDEERLARNPRPIQWETCTGQVLIDGTGVGLVFWSVEGDRIELWDRQGRHPITGAPLKEITAKVARRFCEQLASDKLEREQAIAREQAASQAEEARRQQSAPPAPIQAAASPEPQPTPAAAAPAPARPSATTPAEGTARPTTDSPARVEPARPLERNVAGAPAPSHDTGSQEPQRPLPSPAAPPRRPDPYAGITVR